MKEERGYKTTKKDICATIAAIIFVGIGYLLSNFIASSIAAIPSDFGPPEIIAWIPMIMCSFPLIICIILWVKPKKTKEGPEIHRYRDETIVYTGDYELHSEPSSKGEDTVYLIPAECPSCNSPLSTKEIDWVGPLQAKCPNCGALVDAEERK